MRIVANNNTSSLNIRTLFCCLWVFMFALYYPAARAGFVADFTGWLDQVRNHSFAEYINRSNFKVVSLYQFTQLVTWLFYKLFGINPWLWHLLFITLHVVNACLLCILCGGMLRDAVADNYKVVSYTGAFLFCTTPYIAEVIVWEPSFHYLQGLLLLLLILVWVQRYIHTQRRGYIFLAGFVYILSTHSLEVFYITPWLVLSLGLFYHDLPSGRERFKKVCLYFFLPMLIIFLLRLVEYRLLYGNWVSRIGPEAVLSEMALSARATGFGKPAKYFFHLLALGRYLPGEWHVGGITMGGIRARIYHFCDSAAGIAVFYSACGLVFIWCIARLRKLAGSARAAAVLFLWVFIALVLIIPLWFPDSMLVIYDRYTYFACAFLFMLVAVGIGCVRNKYARLLLLGVIVLANLRFAIQACRYWAKSDRIVSSLLHNLPAHGGKTLLLLNLPETMHGVSMIGANRESEYKLMRNLRIPVKQITTPVYDVLSYNMITPDDGAHVTVLNDSTVRVTLNQWGTWWWYESMGAKSYENDAYRLNLIDAGHYYELTLKRPAERYTLLYQAGSSWKVVDMNKRNEDQY